MPEAGADPSDEEIEQRLRNAPPDRWYALWAAVADVREETQHVEWRGGKQVDTTAVDGVERPVIEMPYAAYSDATTRLIGALGGVGAVVPFPWPDWEGIERYRGGANLATAPVADAVRMVTAIVRADRFVEGSVAGALEDGTLLAAVERIRIWRENK